MMMIATNTGQWGEIIWNRKSVVTATWGLISGGCVISMAFHKRKLCAELQRRGCDIGRTAYAKYESGELNIKASVIIELRKFYNCSYDEFFAGLDE